jgi:hypothetical protein
MANSESNEVVMSRRDNDDRRQSEDRRKEDVPVAAERRQGERRKVQRRRQIDPTTCERDYSNDEIEFMQALDEYKRENGRMFPTCSEILEVIRGLGYRRIDGDITSSADNEENVQEHSDSIGEHDDLLDDEFEDAI